MEESIGKYVETYKLVKIYLNESGYYGDYDNESFGYADKIEDIKDEIDDYMKGPDDPRARQGLGWD